MKHISEMKKRRGEKMVNLYKKYYLDDERIRDILKNGVIVCHQSPNFLLIPVIQFSLIKAQKKQPKQVVGLA